MRRAATIALLLVIGCFGTAAWLSLQASNEVAIVPGSAAGYADLQVWEDEIGWFEGTVTVENDADRDRRVFVTVNLYDGDQNVGELTGSVMLKPESTSAVELISTDDFVAYDEARVELLG